MFRNLPVLVWQEDKWFIAKTLGLEIASQGLTRKEALENLQEAVELYWEEEKEGAPPLSAVNILKFRNLELTRINV